MLFLVPQDPYVMDERDPIKSNALDSSLWEVATLQSHVLPSVATAAKFISNPFPSAEWDLASVLEINENDVSSIRMGKFFVIYTWDSGVPPVSLIFEAGLIFLFSFRKLIIIYQA